MNIQQLITKKDLRSVKRFDSSEGQTDIWFTYRDNVNNVKVSVPLEIADSTMESIDEQLNDMDIEFIVL